MPKKRGIRSYRCRVVRGRAVSRHYRKMKDNCPCPNLACSNHGDCAKCTGSHIGKGYLSYCAFHTILPTLEKVIENDPDSAIAARLRGLIDPQLQAYKDLMSKHGVTDATCKSRLKQVAEYGDG